MSTLQNHCDGKIERECRKKVAKDDLKKVFYRNKTILSFKKYLSNIKQTFNVLGNYNVYLYEENKIRQIMDNTKFQNNYLKTEFNIYRSSHSDIFKTASTFLSTVI